MAALERSTRSRPLLSHCTPQVSRSHQAGIIGCGTERFECWRCALAGRPRTKAKRVVKLRVQANALAAELLAVLPQQYAQDASSADPACRAWRDAAFTTDDICRAYERLSEMCLAKAGITGAEELDEFLDRAGIDRTHWVRPRIVGDEDDPYALDYVDDDVPYWPS